MSTNTKEAISTHGRIRLDSDRLLKIYKSMNNETFRLPEHLLLVDMESIRDLIYLNP